MRYFALTVKLTVKVCRLFTLIAVTIFTASLLNLVTWADNTTPDQISKPNSAAIASAHPLATAAGMRILQAGGNAFDAAVAVAAVLAVVEPYSAGMGGGGFWLLHDANKNHQVVIDAREKAPLNSTSDMYLDQNKQPIPEASINGPLAAGIPGQAAAFVHINQCYGKLPLHQVLQDAIFHARMGFPVNEIYHRLAKYRLDTLKIYPESSKIFLLDGKVPQPGELIIQTELANTLSQLSEKGLEGFYHGDLAETMVQHVNQHGGIWQLKDLEEYQIIEREPLIGHYQQARIITVPPPSAGGIVLISMFNMLEQLALKKMFLNSSNDPDSVTRLHLIIEVMRRAYFDRAKYIGDTDFVSVPINKLISMPHAALWVDSITAKKATPSSQLGPSLKSHSGPHTTHLSVLDAMGNRVAATLSINLPFGSGFTIPGTGVLLNNEMDDFSIQSGTPNTYGLTGATANAIEPGKRPLSSMTPSFIEAEDFIAILGTPGGSRITTMVFLATLEAIAGKDIQSWISNGRYHHQYLPDVVQYEPNTFNENMVKALQDLGHQLEPLSRTYGNMQAIHWNLITNEIKAASDPRGKGDAKVQTSTTTKATQ